MKKVLAIVFAALVVITAAAQSPDTTSTVVGRKLNFEAPIFGLTKRDLKPKWSVVAFDEVSMGLNHLTDIPGEMKPSGLYADMSLLALRYRPWRDGNVFSFGLIDGVDMNQLEKGYGFADDGSIIHTPGNWENAKSYYSDNHFGLQIGYVKEYGDWKAGAFVVPAFGTTQLRNNYTVQGILGINHIGNMETNYGFRLGFKAGVWYQDLGVSVGYKPVIGNNSGQVPMYNTLQIGISVRY
ncbi:MAG: hypothetical protein IKZ60_08885 [Bacteroidales bacterium]|nr:hypothetical protein [Bacteroidales bacterium]